MEPSTKCEFPSNSEISMEHRRNKNVYKDVEKFISYDSSDDLQSDGSLNIHIDSVSYERTIEKMKPIVVEDLEHITGVLGFIKKDYDKVDDDSRMKPLDGALLIAHTSLFIKDKPKPVDCSCCRNKPQVLRLDEASTLPGILKACRWLYPGQTGEFLLPPNTMFGEIGCDEMIPKSATILLAVKSISWIDTGAPKRYLKLKEDVRKDFTAIIDLIDKTFEAACKRYERNDVKMSLTLCDNLINMLKNCNSNVQNREEIYSYMMKTYIHIANCYIKLGKSSIVKNALNEASVLGDYKKNFHYLMTMGKYYYMLQKYEDAMEWYLRALEIEPKNTELAAEILEMDSTVYKYMRDELSFTKNIFSSEKQNLSKQEEELTSANYIKEYCEKFKRSGLKSHSIPPNLILDEIEMLKNVLKTIDGVELKRIGFKSRNDGKMLAYELILSK